MSKFERISNIAILGIAELGTAQVVVLPLDNGTQVFDNPHVFIAPLIIFGAGMLGVLIKSDEMENTDIFSGLLLGSLLIKILVSRS
jgi:hypothetical protein